MNAMISELEKLVKTETVTKEQFQQLSLIVLEIARSLEAKEQQRQLQSRMHRSE